MQHEIGLISTTKQKVQSKQQSTTWKSKDHWVRPMAFTVGSQDKPTAGMQTSLAQRLTSRRTRTLLPTTATLPKPKIPVDDLQELRTRHAKQARYCNKTATDLPSLQPGKAVRIQPHNAYDHPWIPATVQRQITSDPMMLLQKMDDFFAEIENIYERHQQQQNPNNRQHR